MRSGDSPDHVEGIADMSHPIAQSLVHCVLKCSRAAGHFMDASTEQLHAKDVERLTSDVLGAHKNIALQTKESGNRRGGNTMLAGAGFSNHLAFSHTAGQKNLTNSIINFMSTGMI